MWWLPHSGFVRIGCVERCQVEDGAGRRDGVVWNLSARGVYLVINPIPPEDEGLRLSFHLPDDPNPIRTDGRVTWRNPPTLRRDVARRAMDLPAGCGVQFLALKAGDRRRIEGLIRLAVPRTATPSVPSRRRARRRASRSD